MIDINELKSIHAEIESLKARLAPLCPIDQRLYYAMNSLSAAASHIPPSIYSPRDDRKKPKPISTTPFVHNGLAPEGECTTCDSARANRDSMMPNHNASVRCQSGGHNHCTCDTCF